jgi:hypothetical protein
MHSSLSIITLFTDVLSKRRRTRTVRKHKTKADLSDSLKFVLGAVSILTRNIYNKENVGRSAFRKECHGVYDEQHSITSLKTAIEHYHRDSSDISGRVFSEALKETTPKFKTQLDKCLSAFGVNYYNFSILEVMEFGSAVDEIMKAKNLSFVKMLAEGHMAFEKVSRESNNVRRKY